LGYLDDYCAGGNSFYPGSKWFWQQSIVLSILWSNRPTTLCRINEPPKGYDVNVITIEDCQQRTVTFVLERDVMAGEELYIDYGLSYDRSHYGGGGCS
jgi:hypothetical protein